LADALPCSPRLHSARSRKFGKEKERERGVSPTSGMMRRYSLVM
jgi:hypothetical protein